MACIFLFIAFDRLQPRWRSKEFAQELAPEPAPEPAREDLPAPALEGKPRFYA
jgi:hypothetical protein